MWTPFRTGLRPEVVVLLALDTGGGIVAGLGLLDGRIAQAGVAGVGVSKIFALAICLAFIAVLAVSGLYQPAAWFRPRRLAGRAIVAALLLVLGTVMMAALLGAGPPLPQAHLWTIPAAYAAVATALRVGFAAALRERPVGGRLAIVTTLLGKSGAYGNTTPAALGLEPHEVAVAMQHSDAMPAHVAADHLRRSGARAVIATEPASLPQALLGDCEAAGMRVISAAVFRERRLRRVDLDSLPHDWLSFAAITKEGAFEATLRRSFDILGCVALLLATLPVLVLTALAIRIESPGPILYRQERVGRGGRIFTIFKFRSMAADAEAGGPQWAKQRDPRVTRVGRFIRLTRIDELPQVINVLRGEMALIGPRPERPAFVEQLTALIPHYGSRCAVKPGITGWAQVNYPYGASVEDARNKLTYDLYYIRQRSFALDLAIILGTIRVILFQEGAR